MCNKIAVDRAALSKLLEESAMLTALIGLGVDNWEVFDEATSLYFESKNDLVADFYERYTEGDENVN